MPKTTTGVVRGRKFWSVTPTPRKSKRTPRRETTPPRKMSSKQLCTSLVGIAAFHVEDKAAQMKIYEAVRRLHVLEAAAIDAGLLPSGDSSSATGEKS